MIVFIRSVTLCLLKIMLPQCIHSLFSFGPLDLLGSSCNLSQSFLKVLICMIVLANDRLVKSMEWLFQDYNSTGLVSSLNKGHVVKTFERNGLRYADESPAGLFTSFRIIMPHWYFVLISSW